MSDGDRPRESAPAGSGRLDRFVSSRASTRLALAWGLAEATFFFLVPDVLLTLAGMRRLGRAMLGTLAALAGALVGGAAMYGFGAEAPQAARSFLEAVPGIDRAMIASVGGQLDAEGLASILTGPIQGIPYKIYAVEWGIRGGDFVGFLLISVPARYFRFALTALAASGIARLLAPWTRRSPRTELTLLAIFWVAFYTFYFATI